LVYKVKANEKGSLFSKVTEADISKALLDSQRISIDPSLLKIVGGQIKQVGEYEVIVTDEGYKSSFMVSVQN
jgi:ribosomal protein L9